MTAHNPNWQRVQYSSSLASLLDEWQWREGCPVSRMLCTQMDYTVIKDGYYPKDENGNYILNEFGSAIYHDAELDYTYYTTTEFANYITRRGDMFSFLPAGKPTENRWARADRQTMKPGRLVGKLLTKEAMERLTSKDIEAFANRIKAQAIGEEGDFRLVKGEDIRYWYHGDRYARSQGSLNQSCMAHDHCQGFFDIYTENEDRVNMLIMVNKDEKLLGRAIVWTLDNDKRFMDRIYGNDATIEAFCDYAATQGWWRKTHQNYDSARDVTYPDGSEGWESMQVSLDTVEVEAYPYMDTMQHLHDWGVSNGGSGYGYAQLTFTNGGPGARTECHDCGDRIDPDDAYTYEGDPHCYTCYYDNHQCPECRENEVDDGEVCSFCEEHRCQGCEEIHRPRYSWSRGYYGGLTEGYCQDCLPEHVCQDCESVVDYTIDSHGYCDDCVEKHTCEGCQLITDDLDEGLCADCVALTEPEVA